MEATTDETIYTPEDLLSMPDGDHYELIDGKLVVHEMGNKSAYIALWIARLLQNYCIDRSFGWVLPSDATYQCFPNERMRVRKPDASVIRFGRLADERIPDDHVMIPPDLAVEVVSPRDLAYEVDRKVEDYLGAGVLMVWI